MTTYMAAPEATRIAEHHTHLTDVRVECVFRDKASKSNGKIVLGKARKVSGLNAYLARITDAGENTGGDEFFVIEIAADEWDEMPPSKRRALVDHELCYCTIDYDEDKDVVTLGIRAHDVEEFTEIVQRHGLWKDDLAEFGKAAKEQLDLWGDDGPPTGSVEEAVADFADSVLGDGIDSVTISSGGESATIDKDTAKRLRESS